MHAWESIQKTLIYIEENIKEDIKIEDLAEIACLSLFYYQRLFSRLVKKSLREYIKLRRLARSCEILSTKDNGILNVALEYGFSTRETFTRAFKETYGITPSQYRDRPVELMHFDKPNLLLNYTMVEEGVPLISEGLVLEYHRQTLKEPIRFLGVNGYYSFTLGKMLGERTGVAEDLAIWDTFYSILKYISYESDARLIGVSYPGDAPVGYSSYFVGVEVNIEDSRFDSWQLPPRDYIVCSLEVERQEQFADAVGKMMKFTRIWLKKHGLIADEFFPEMYYNTPKISYMEMWIPFKKRENDK